MGKSFSRELAEWMAKVDKQLSHLSSGNRLDHASLDGTTLYLRDADGNLSGRLGRQPDGSNGVHVVRVQPPPQLTAPILTVGEQAGTCLVEWDGHTFDGRRMPLIHGHTEVWAELVGEDWSPTVAPGDAGKRVGTIRDRTGGEATVSLPQAGTWAVWLRAMGADRETAGPWSPVATVEIKPLVDTEAIEAELDDARQRITEADERLTAGQEALAVNLDDLNENRLPALRDRLDTIEPVIEDYDDRITAAHDGAQSARDTAENLRDNVLPPLSADLSDLTENRLPTVEGTLSETRLGMENLRDVTLPDLDQELRAGIQGVGASVESLQIGNWDNLFSDPNFQLIGSDGSLPQDESWFYQGGTQAWYRYTTGNQGSTLFNNTDGVSSTIYFRPNGRGVTVRSGEEYELTATVQRPAGASGNTPIFWTFFHRGGSTSNVTAFQPGTGINEYVSTITVPDDTSIERMGWGFGKASNATGYVRILGVSARKKVHGRLLVDGTIGADQIIANEIAAAVGEFLQISAEQIDTENLAAYLATIIELDAGQITAGKINTARLDAQEVAGAVANFLTLDALEINFEQLAGEIANIIELTAENLAARSIYGHHLALGAWDNFIPDPKFQDTAWWTGISAGSLVTSDVLGRESLRVLRSTVDQGQVDISTALYDAVPGNSYALQFDAARAGSQSNDNYRVWVRGLTRSGGWVDSIGLTLERYATTVGGRVTHQFTIPEGTDVEVWEVNWRFENLSSLHVEIANPSLRQMGGAELVIDGSLKSRSIDTEEFFAAEAVIEKVWTDIVRSRLVESQGIITEDMIATGAITTPKLTVTEEMVAQIASFIRIEAGSLASNDIEAMRIVSSLIEATTYLIHNADGDVSVRLDGMNNFIAGELNTFATPAERDAQLGPNVTLGTSASTISPPIDWRREQDGWVPTPGAWKLDEINFSNQPTDDPIPLNIHPDLQGQFSRYEIIIRAGVVEGGFEAKALMVLPNSEWGTGLERYRVVARAEDVDGTVVLSQSTDANGWPQTGYVGPYNGHLQINFHAIPYGDTRYMTWDTTGWVNMGGGSFAGGYLVRSGGRWNPPNPVPLTHFGIRPAIGNDRTWYSTSIAELWGYR